MVARALAIALPWLALVPIANGAIAVLLYAFALAASFHGWGLAIARRRDVAPLRAIQWGIATVIGIAGVAIALGVYTAIVEAGVLFGGVAIHTVVIATRPMRLSLRDARYWLIPVGLLAIIGTVAVLGAAGDFASRPFDDDGNLLGEIRRLADTGSLGDAAGYPRAFQLGGHAALAAFANVIGDPRLARMVDALAMVLALALAISRIRPREPHAALWSTLVVLAASALALPVSDPSPMWLGIGLMLALFDDDVPAIPLGVVTGALIVLRLAFAPLAIVALVWGARGKRLPIAAAAAFAVIAPYLIALLRASGSAPSPSSGLGKLAIAAAIALALLPLLVVALRDLRGVAFASAAGLAGIAAQLTGDHGARFAWAIAIACLLALAVELARRPDVFAPIGMLATLVLAVLIFDGREAPGRASWYRRTADLVDNIVYLARNPIAPPRDLDAILATIAGDALVGLWLPEPERIDHAHHRIVDLRTPRVASMRDHRFDGKPPQLESFAASLGVRYLLLAPDDEMQQRRMQLPRGAACSTPSAKCADAIELLHRHSIVARRDGIELIDLKD